MDELVRVMQNQAVVSSLQIAEHFGKRHNHLQGGEKMSLRFAEELEKDFIRIETVVACIVSMLADTFTKSELQDEE